MLGVTIKLNIIGSDRENNENAKTCDVGTTAIRVDRVAQEYVPAVEKVGQGDHRMVDREQVHGTRRNQHKHFYLYDIIESNLIHSLFCFVYKLN